MTTATADWGTRGSGCQARTNDFIEPGIDRIDVFSLPFVPILVHQHNRRLCPCRQKKSLEVFSFWKHFPAALRCRPTAPPHAVTRYLLGYSKIWQGGGSVECGVHREECTGGRNASPPMLSLQYFCTATSGEAGFVGTRLHTYILDYCGWTALGGPAMCYLSSDSAICNTGCYTHLGTLAPAWLFRAS